MKRWSQQEIMCRVAQRHLRLMCICLLSSLESKCVFCFVFLVCLFVCFRHCQSAPYRHHVTLLQRKRIKKRTDTSTSCHVSDRTLTLWHWRTLTIQKWVYLVYSLLIQALISTIIVNIRQLTVKGSLQSKISKLYFCLGWIICNVPCVIKIPSLSVLFLIFIGIFSPRLLLSLSQMTTPGCISHLWRESPTRTSSTLPL